MMSAVSRWFLVAWWLAAAGCNQILGLDETSPRDAGSDVIPGDAGDPNDRDGDGRLNQNDNCPDRANTDQHDEDNDGFGDLCDNCPHIGNPEQTDDGEDDVGLARDGVGDLCDPHDEAPGDRLAFFDGFGSLTMGWIETGGTWEIVDDHLAQTDVAAGEAVRYLSMVTYDEIVVHTWFHVREVQPGTDTPRWVGAVVRVGQDGSTGYVCRWGSDKGPPAYQLELVRKLDGSDVNDPVRVGELTFDMEIGMDIEYLPRDDTPLDCYARGKDPLQGSIAATDGSPLPPGSVGLYTQGAVGWYDFLAVYVRDMP